MKRNKLYTQIVPKVLLALTLTCQMAPSFSSPTKADPCAEALIQLAGQKSSKHLAYRFPKAASALERESDSNFQFGFESEYMLNEITGILKFYGPDPKLGLSKAKWASMTDEAKLVWAKDNIKTLFPTFREKGNLVKISDELPSSFPDRLIRDETGNIELIAGPFETYEEWENFVKLTNSHFGEGSMQSTLSMKWEHFFNTKFAEFGKGAAEWWGPMAHIKAHNEVDQILKLQAAAQKVPEKGFFRAARNFEHPFLAPMSLDKEKMLASHMQLNVTGEGFEKEVLEDIAHSDASYKYIGGVAYRPDIVGKKRIVLEIRQAHKNTEILTKKLNELLSDFESGREYFASTLKWRSFDKRKLFKEFSEDTQSMLKEIYPNKKKPGIDYTIPEQRALEVSENYSWPLRDWKPFLETFRQSKISAKVSKSQQRYKFKLDQIAMNYRQHVLSAEQAREQVETELALFVDQSGIGTAAQGWYKNYKESTKVSALAR